MEFKPETKLSVYELVGKDFMPKYILNLHCKGLSELKNNKLEKTTFDVFTHRKESEVDTKEVIKQIKRPYDLKEILRQEEADAEMEKIFMQYENKEIGERKLYEEMARIGDHVRLTTFNTINIKHIIRNGHYQAEQVEDAAISYLAFFQKNKLRRNGANFEDEINSLNRELKSIYESENINPYK